jgi:hypothetical protein
MLPERLVWCLNRRQGGLGDEETLGGRHGAAIMMAAKARRWGVAGRMIWVG